MSQTQKNNTQKPISVTIQEFKNDIFTIVKNHQLHPSIVEMVMKDMYLEIKNLADNQLKLEEKEYTEQLNQSKESPK